MENKITSELIEKAKAANSPEELLALAKDNGIEVSEEQAKEYFGQLQGDGELSDEELENVAGGGCANKYPLTNPVKNASFLSAKNAVRQVWITYTAKTKIPHAEIAAMSKCRLITFIVQTPRIKARSRFFDEFSRRRYVINAWPRSL